MTTMPKIAQFEKVSYEQFKNDFLQSLVVTEKTTTVEEMEKLEDTIHEVYDAIKLPTRATTGSAGYDFSSPMDITLLSDKVVTIPTGVRCHIEEGWTLQLYPRSGHGFKWGLALANTVGIIDSDYYNAKNEGHIIIKLTNESILSRSVSLDKGTAICQGVFVPFGITINDEVSTVRQGGFGSTDV